MTCNLDSNCLYIFVHLCFLYMLFIYDELVKKKDIPITQYDFPSQNVLHTIFFESCKNVMNQFNTPVSIKLDQLWHSGGLSTSTMKPYLNWKEFMQDISTGHHQPKSKTVMLPIIDLNSNDKTCVHSVLLFAIEQSKKLNVKEPFNTCGQPLWFKALEIITPKELKIVSFLGGFHMLMSFYGGIGTIMPGYCIY